MSQTKTRGSVLAIFAVAALLFVGAWPAASSSNDSEGGGAEFVSLASQQQAVDYWTTPRLESALPGDLLILDRDLSQIGQEVAAGLPQLLPGTTGLDSLLGGLIGGLFPFNGGLYTGGGEVTTTTGKVFFTLDGQDFQCSGSSVNSNNGSVVVTAGHCLNSGPGAYATNFVFIPEYRDGARPHGTFPARALVATEQWRTAGDLNYDIGYAIVSTVDGQTLNQTVGGQGIAFNQPRGQHYHAFGYPAAGQYNGERLAWCHGQARNDVLGSDSQGVRCNMTGGSSGGPWFLQFNTDAGVGIVNSVNSFKYVLPGLDGNMYGPYFGTAAQELFATAQNM